ncbi:MAG: hypothetical protein QOI59_3839 [Gammaproteobacteria bacterium]|jgi:hypothetical protein|nr:hypothetical protein [Gammaproteobacteria bacterium]
MDSLTSSSAASVVVDPDGVFPRNYNRVDFMFPHGLAGNPLWQLDNLVELSRRMPDHRETYWSNGPIAVNNNWEYRQNEKLSLDETMVNIAHNNSFVILKHAEQDPVYGPLLQSVLARIVALSGERMRRDVTIGEVLIMISSPSRVTPYHMDSETNFLLQVAGDKTFYVFDQTDRTLVTDLELERFYAVSQVLATYRPERQAEASAYDLKAGFGIHVPPNAPHWVQNSDNVSVALSVNYELRSIDRLQELHKLNRRLRDLGLKPTAPGRYGWLDQVKLATIRAARALQRRRPVERIYPVWTPPLA